MYDYDDICPRCKGRTECVNDNDFVSGVCLKCGREFIGDKIFQKTLDEINKLRAGYKMPPLKKLTTVFRR